MPSRSKKDAKPMSSDEENVHQETHATESFSAPATHSESDGLTLQVSKALRKRLEHSAREEGVSVEDLASELLAEGLVLRAWEIVERKSAMRGGGGGQQQHQQQQRQGNTRQGHQGHGGGNNKQGHGGGGNKHGGGRMNKRHAAHATSLNLMEDKAAFLEYVRNQERKQR